MERKSEQSLISNIDRIAQALENIFAKLEEIRVEMKKRRYDEAERERKI